MSELPSERLRLPFEINDQRALSLVSAYAGVPLVIGPEVLPLIQRHTCRFCAAIRVRGSSDVRPRAHGHRANGLQGPVIECTSVSPPREMSTAHHNRVVYITCL